MSVPHCRYSRPAVSRSDHFTSFLIRRWLHEHQAEFKTNRSSKFMALATLNVFIVLGGLFCCVAGTVGSVIAINKSLHNGSTTA